VVFGARSDDYWLEALVVSQLQSEDASHFSQVGRIREGLAVGRTCGDFVIFLAQFCCGFLCCIG